MSEKFIVLFWQHKWNWRMYLRLCLCPIMLALVFVGAFCEWGFGFMNGVLAL